MRVSIHPEGAETAAGSRVVYDVDRDEARYGAAHVHGPAIVWEVDDRPEGDWLIRCDRVDFPPGGVAYRHTHPGPGIRYLLHGSITIEAGGETHDYGPGDAWFESGAEPVLATASTTEESAFARVLLLPPEWAGKRTIRYVDPADEDRPKLQRPTVFGEYPVAF